MDCMNQWTWFFKCATVEYFLLQILHKKLLFPWIVPRCTFRVPLDLNSFSQISHWTFIIDSNIYYNFLSVFLPKQKIFLKMLRKLSLISKELFGTREYFVWVDVSPQPNGLWSNEAGSRLLRGQTDQQLDDLKDFHMPLEANLVKWVKRLGKILKYYKLIWKTELRTSRQFAKW